MFSWYPPYIQLLLTCVVFSNQKMCWKWLITFSIPSSLAFSRLICERFWVGLPARASMQHQSDSVWSKFCKNHENWNGVKSQRNGVKSQRNGVIFFGCFFQEMSAARAGWLIFKLALLTIHATETWLRTAGMKSLFLTSCLQFSN